MKTLDKEFLFDINNYITKNNDNPTNILSCYASMYYYNNVELQIASVVRSIIKNHYFIDGNKRTTALVLLILCDENNISTKLNDNNIDDVMVNIAENNYSVEEIKDMLF